MEGVQMKAAVCREFGKPLVIEDLQLDAPNRGEIRVKLAACAICHSDILFADGAWGGDLPAVYGHEAAGRVVEAGPEVTGFRPGDHVVVTLIRSCGGCHYCDQGQAVLCDTEFPLDENSPLHGADGHSVHHGLRTGAFAEEVVIDASQAVKIPEHLPLDSASLLACGVITGVGAVTNTAAVPPGSSVAVIGTGGVGLNSVQGAKLCGAQTIIAIDLADDKLAAAKRFGATHTINTTNEDAAAAVRGFTQGRGVDFAFVTVGAKSAIEQAFGLIGRGGCVVIVGMTASGVRTAFEPLNFANDCQQVLGSKMGGTRLKVDVPRLVELYEQGRLKLDELITGRYPLEEINEAIASVRRGEALRNVIVF
jgi:S-(hydroxymethyl)glutathione dehydrogenase/alcohol dehydrogenase